MPADDATGPRGSCDHGRLHLGLHAVVPRDERTRELVLSRRDLAAVHLERARLGAVHAKPLALVEKSRQSALDGICLVHPLGRSRRDPHDQQIFAVTTAGSN